MISISPTPVDRASACSGVVEGTYIYVFIYLTLSLRNFWHPFPRSVRNYIVDARKNHGYGYKNWYISITNKARHKICTSLDL